MLRVLRIIGIVLFACIIGFSANSLKIMHENGELMEQYNSSRKANITLLTFSLLALSTLGYFEMSRVRRMNKRQRYGESRYREETEDEVSGLDSTSIYATPKSQDEWMGRHTRSSRSRHKPAEDSENIWFNLLKIIFLVLPVVYLALLSITLIRGHEEPLVAIILPSVFGILFVLTMIAGVGVFSKKSWGMMTGYTLAVGNLLIFPYGTAVGLFLMMGLVGASSIFQVSAAQDRRKKGHRNAARSAQYPAI
jgi:hypothetical protein